jgi:hypothetical protein
MTREENFGTKRIHPAKRETRFVVEPRVSQSDTTCPVTRVRHAS